MISWIFDSSVHHSIFCYNNSEEFKDAHKYNIEVYSKVWQPVIFVTGRDVRHSNQDEENQDNLYPLAIAANNIFKVGCEIHSKAIEDHNVFPNSCSEQNWFILL